MFRESAGCSSSSACHATPRKMHCHLYGRAVLGQPSLRFGAGARFYSVDEAFGFSMFWLTPLQEMWFPLDGTIVIATPNRSQVPEKMHLSPDLGSVNSWLFVQRRSKASMSGVDVLEQFRGRTSLEQNPQFMGRFSARSRRKGNRIIRSYGAGDGNRTHFQTLGNLGPES